MTKVLGIIAIKGGVGKTTTSANVGAALSDEFMKRVLIVDANFSAPNLGLHLGIVKPEYTLHDVLSDKIDIADAIIKHEYGFDVLPASLVPKKINPYKLKNRLEKIKSEYDYIILDSSPTMNEEILSTMIASDELLVVTTPDYPTLSCTLQAINVAKKKKTNISGLIINKIRNKKFELQLDEIEQATSVPVLAMLPDDVKVLQSLSTTMPLVLESPASEAAVEYKKLCASLIGEHYKDPRTLKRSTRFIGKEKKHELNRQLLSDQIRDGK
jgi:septum site-determining protein MinD